MARFGADIGKLYVICKQGGAIWADGANPHSGVRFAFGGLLGNAGERGGAYSNQVGGAMDWRPAARSPC